jgi:hypothetical protein
MKKQTDVVRQVSGGRSPQVRSRVTNGRMLFLEGNGRTPLHPVNRAQLEAVVGNRNSPRNGEYRSAIGEPTTQPVEGQVTADGVASHRPAPELPN